MTGNSPSPSASSTSFLLNSEKYFIVNDKNELLSYKGLTEWLPELPEESYMGFLSLQHYTQLRSFAVIVVKSGETIGETESPLSALYIPYTFKLKDHTSFKSNGATATATATAPATAAAFTLLFYTRVDNTVCHESPYLNMVRKIMNTGESRDDRTGTGTLSIFGHQIRFDISESVPLLTTKFVPWKSCLHELLWFLRGSTDSRELEAKKVGIWKGNTRRAFLDQRGLTDLPEGDIGAGYGFQWRHFGADYSNCEADYTGQGVDQIKEVIRQLKEEPTSRRIVLTAWNPLALSKMALPPCHILCQFYVSYPVAIGTAENTPMLSCHLYQRSQDVFLGAPFNLFSYTALTYLLAKICGMRPRELIVSTGDTHIYKDHLTAMKEQLQRVPLTAPVLTVSPHVASKALEDITLDDFQLDGYFYHPRLYGAMSV